MTKNEEHSKPQNPRPTSRMPQNSTYFEKIVPVLLSIMAVVMLGLILFAISVLLGIVTF